MMIDNATATIPNVELCFNNHVLRKIAAVFVYTKAWVQQVFVSDSSAPGWAWLQGTCLEQQGKTDAAMGAYSASITQLQKSVDKTPEVGSTSLCMNTLGQIHSHVPKRPL
jgi:hypothetical protein